ncbi:Glycosyl transferase family 2 [Candidatus Magnetomoraceae bacterium gMMP-13]
MKFSIITPSYNGYSSIKRMIGSVRGQITDDIEVEHFVQDACSTDGTQEFLTRLCKSNKWSEPDEKRIKHLNNHRILRDKNYRLSWISEPDKGMYDAINKGWEKASGQVFSWLNCDEQYVPGILQKISDIFKKYPNVEMVYGNTIVVDEFGNPLSARKDLQLNHFIIKNTFLYVFSGSYFFRRSLWDKNLLRLDDSFRYSADMDTILCLLSAGIKTHFFNEYLSLFQWDGDSISTHPAKPKETSFIQEKYGASSIRAFRNMVRAMRWGLRLIRGHYLPQRVAYDYATDETPNYRHIRGICCGKLNFIGYKPD